MFLDAAAVSEDAGNGARAKHHAQRIDVCCKRKRCHQMVGVPVFCWGNHRTMVVIFYGLDNFHELLAEAGSSPDGHWCGLGWLNLCGWCPKSSISRVFRSDGLRTGDIWQKTCSQSTAAMLKVEMIESHLVLWQWKLFSAWRGCHSKAHNLSQFNISVESGPIARSFILW